MTLCAQTATCRDSCLPQGHMQDSPHEASSTQVTPTCKTADPRPAPHNHSHPTSHQESWQNAPWHGGHKMTAPLEGTATQETATG